MIAHRGAGGLLLVTAAPHIGAGSVRRLVAARQHLPAGPVDLAGDHMTASWVEGAVRSGQLAADRIADVLTPASR
jgi:monoamine oxidase